MTSNLAPIVLFVYNRPEHTRHTVDALRNNLLAEQSELFIFADGAKKAEDINKVNEVREYIGKITGFKRVVVKERKENYGLAKSVVSGVTEIVNQYKKVIVLEDDLITDKQFLKYMNMGLDIYQDEPQVYSITGYSYFREGLKDIDTCFLKITSSWSWATWKDRWDQYDPECKGWESLQRDHRLRKQFDYDYSYPYYRLLQMQLKDAKINSWAIKWYWTVFKKGGLTLYPGVSLVQNAGFDGSGEHCGTKQTNFQIYKQENEIEKMKFENNIKENALIRKQTAKAIYRKHGIMGKMQIMKDMLS
ncbi:MAG: glycosyltransferase [Ruminococcus sp.]|nr:glycosyltransferase [Ruminococcus sp.]MCM1153916.1 glycosyltransferase [Roseburia sp.]